MCTLVNPVLRRSVISSWPLHMKRGGRKPRMISEAAIVRITIPGSISALGVPVLLPRSVVVLRFVHELAVLLFHPRSHFLQNIMHPSVGASCMLGGDGRGLTWRRSLSDVPRSRKGPMAHATPGSSRLVC